MAASKNWERLVLVTLPAAVDSWAVASRVRVLAPRVRVLAPRLPLVVRADSMQGVDDLLALGALHVVQPEFEAAQEMVREALLELGVDEELVLRELEEERAGHFARP